MSIYSIPERQILRNIMIYYRAGLKSSHGEGTPASTIQEPDLGRVYDVAAYGNKHT